MTVLVLEGPDGGGKSTLLQAIKDADMNLETLHPGKPPTDYMSLLEMLNSQIQVPKQAIRVYDRLTCISEWVYRPFRIDPTIDVVNEQGVYSSLLESQMVIGAHMNWVIIYCRPDTEVLLSQSHLFNENDTDDTIRVVQEHAKEIIYTYDALMVRLERFGFKVVRFDYINHDMDELIKSIMEV